METIKKVTGLKTNDNDTLEHWEGELSPAEVKALRWITLDRTRAFCSGDLIELPGIRSKGTARNIIWKFKKLDLIELFCKSVYAFYKVKSIDRSKIKAPMTTYRMRSSGLKRVHVDFSALLDSMTMEELCKVHDVHLAFAAEELYPILHRKGTFRIDPFSKDIYFGSFIWSKYRSLKVILHKTGNISFILKCSNCPVEASAIGFMGMAAYLGGIRN